MLIRIDSAAGTDLHTQIAGQIQAAIIGGSLSPGDKLPPARDLAASLDVNMHTVLRAYHRLRDDGIVELRRGRGVTVLRHPSRARLVELLAQLVSEAERLGVSRAELTRLLVQA